MGLFFNSETKIKKDQILRDIAIVNNALRNIAITIDENEMNITTINSINSIFVNVETNITRISTIVQGMSDSDLTGFIVPWMDGSYIGIMTWIASFGALMNMLAGEMESYILSNR
jgi:hypothetical protein